MMIVPVGCPLLRLVSLAYRANQPVMLVGSHGLGKSEVLVKAASELGIECRVLDLSLCEAVDLVGLPRLDGDTTKFLPPAMLPNRGAGLLVLEELNRAPRHVRAPCLQLLTARRLNDYVLPARWLPVAAMNADVAEDEGDDAEELSAVYQVDELDPALASRFLRVQVKADVDEWLAWARANRLHEAVVDAVEAGREEALTRSSGNPRAWAYASRLFEAFDPSNDSEDTLLAALVGVLGDRWGTIALRTFTTAQKPLAASEVVNKMPHWRPLVEAWRRTQRIDLLTATWAALQRYLSANRAARAVAMDADRHRNVKVFIDLLPADVRREARSWLDAQLAPFASKGQTHAR